MASSDIKDVKRRISSVTSMEHITNAMKLVSAAKLRRAKATFEKTNENFHFVIHSIKEIFANEDDVPSKYLAGNREIKKTCYIIISSGRGLCGGFNSNIIKEAKRSINEEGGESVIVAIGKRGLEYFQRRDYEILEDYVAPPESISFLESMKIARPILELYESGEIDQVKLIYTSYISPLDQRVRNITLLPFDIKYDPEILMHPKAIEYHPSVEEVFNYLVPKYVEISIHGAIVESATCEHAARRMAMENATENARDMLDNLSLNYNRARQSAITDEIIEIVAGSEAQK
ncbi:MAG: ATP synthase F1 subunit gamma [Anaerovoracaceae bacterium]